MFRTFFLLPVIAIGLMLTSAHAEVKTPEFNQNEVIGMFANVGTVGPLAGTKTVTEAHAICLAKGNIGSDVYKANDSAYHDGYKTCMAQYVPFKVAGLDAAGSCGSSMVTWGQCEASFQASPEGASVSLQNQRDTENFEGFATFKCENGTPTYISGGCSRAVKECAAGQIVNWPVTSPLWADESTGTVYKDKYGEIIHTPKSRCYARMPASTSGELHFPKPTVPEMVEPARYNMNSGVTPQRCFDSKWMSEPASGVSACEYIPKTCAAQSVNHNGCGFDLPASAHDTIFVDDTPTPQNSLGSVEAYCFDGEWKVKARSCQLSCQGNIGAYSWSGSDPRACAHNGLSQASRIAPGSNIVINNNVAGMSGSVTYRCNNGNFTSLSEPCEPLGCSNVANATWSGNGKTCSHDAVSGKWSHGNNITLSSETSILVASGQRSYTCNYGSMSLAGESCDGGPVLCDNTGTGPGACPNGVVVNNVCCEVVNGKTVCGDSGGGSGGSTPPKPSILAETKAGCYVDTREVDKANENSCASSGERVTGQPAVISFSVGDFYNEESWTFSTPGVSVKWTGDCTGTSSNCAISGECRYDGITTKCPALGTKRATATVTYQGETKVFNVTGIDNSRSMGDDLFD